MGCLPILSYTKGFDLRRKSKPESDQKGQLYLGINSKKSNNNPIRPVFKIRSRWIETIKFNPWLFLERPSAFREGSTLLFRCWVNSPVVHFVPLEGSHYLKKKLMEHLSTMRWLSAYIELIKNSWAADDPLVITPFDSGGPCDQSQWKTALHSGAYSERSRDRWAHCIYWFHQGKGQVVKIPARSYHVLPFDVARGLTPGRDKLSKWKVHYHGHGRFHSWLPAGSGAMTREILIHRELLKEQRKTLLAPYNNLGCYEKLVAR